MTHPRRIDVLTNHGIIVLSEVERSLMIEMLGTAVDKMVADNSDESLEALNLYNKMAIGRAADSTVEHHFGIHKQNKESKNAARKKKPRRSNPG